MSVKERLTTFIKTLNIGQGAFEKTVGLSNGYVNNIRVSIQPDKLQKIALMYPNLNTGWLITGEGEMLKQNRGYVGIKSDPTEQDSIPLLETSIEAGILKGFAESQVKNSLPHYRVPGFKGADFLATVTGESMIDRYWPGDVVGCKIVTKSSFIQWGKVHVIDTDQGGLIKKLMPSDKDDFIKAVSFNASNYPPFEIPKSDVIEIAIVLGVVRLI